MIFMVHERFMVHSLVSLVVGLWFMGYGLSSLVYGLLSGLMIIFSKVYYKPRFIVICIDHILQGEREEGGGRYG